MTLHSIFIDIVTYDRKTPIGTIAKSSKKKTLKLNLPIQALNNRIDLTTCLTTDKEVVRLNLLLSIILSEKILVFLNYP